MEADGRANVITMHPDFRMLVLANRPGFPFLGNDFFGALGKTFGIGNFELNASFFPNINEELLENC